MSRVGSSIRVVVVERVLHFCASSLGTNWRFSKSMHTHGTVAKPSFSDCGCHYTNSWDNTLEKVLSQSSKLKNVYEGFSRTMVSSISRFGVFSVFAFLWNRGYCFRQPTKRKKEFESLGVFQWSGREINEKARHALKHIEIITAPSAPSRTGHNVFSHLARRTDQNRSPRKHRESRANGREFGQPTLLTQAYQQAKSEVSWSTELRYGSSSDRRGQMSIQHLFMINPLMVLESLRMQKIWNLTVRRGSPKVQQPLWLHLRCLRLPSLCVET